MGATEFDKPLDHDLDELNSKMANLIKTGTIPNVTTNGQGFYISTLADSIRILNAWAEGPLVWWKYAGHWVFGLMNQGTTGNMVANATINISYEYLEI